MAWLEQTQSGATTSPFATAEGNSKSHFALATPTRRILGCTALTRTSCSLEAVGLLYRFQFGFEIRQTRFNICVGLLELGILCLQLRAPNERHRKNTICVSKRCLLQRSAVGHRVFRQSSYIFQRRIAGHFAARADNVAIACLFVAGGDCGCHRVPGGVSQRANGIDVA